MTPIHQDTPSLSQLIDAVLNDDVDEVIELLHEGADPSAVEDEAGITPLHFAAQSNSLSVIPALILAGADIHARTQPDHLTPLAVALLHNNERVANLLFAYENIHQQVQ